MQIPELEQKDHPETMRTLTCIRCSKQFDTTAGGPPVKFCSPECRCLARREHYKVPESLRVAPGPCPACGGFVDGHHNKKFCSVECNFQFRREKSRMERVALLVEVKCSECKKLFMPQSRSNTLCSDECRASRAARFELRKAAFKKQYLDQTYGDE